MGERRVRNRLKRVHATGTVSSLMHLPTPALFCWMHETESSLTQLRCKWLSPKREKDSLADSMIYFLARRRMQRSIAEMVGAFVPRIGLSNIVCSDVPQDDVRFRICDCNCRGASTSLTMGGVEMSFSVVEGETDLPFLPEGAGVPFGQGVRGHRGLSAVLAGVRQEELSRKLTRAFLVLIDGFRRRQPSQCVGDQSQSKNTTDARTIQHLRRCTRRALDSHHRTY
jgi:hypothetical protein